MVLIRKGVLALEGGVRPSVSTRSWQAGWSCPAGICRKPWEREGITAKKKPAGGPREYLLFFSFISAEVACFCRSWGLSDGADDFMVRCYVSTEHSQASGEEKQVGIEWK